MEKLKKDLMSREWQLTLITNLAGIAVLLGWMTPEMSVEAQAQVNDAVVKFMEFIDSAFILSRGMAKWSNGKKS